MRRPKEDSITKVLLVIIILLTASFMYSMVKEKAPYFVSAPINRPESLSAKFIEINNLIAPPVINPPVVLNPPPTPWKIYSNKQYGFAFIYPSDWILRENGSNKQVTVQTDTPALEVIGFQVADKSFFTPYVKTKYGEITYDGTKKTLLNISQTPPGCLAVSTLSGVPGAMKSIIYSGDLVSDPAHSESAVLTKTGSIIIASESWEVGSDQNQNKQIKDDVAKIMTSFTLLNGNTVSIPNCTTGN
jgi:hypothetical protein